MTDEETAAALRRAATQLSLRLRAERPSGGPARLGLALLGHLYRQGPLTASELAAAEGLRPQSVTRPLASLEDQGFLARTPDPADRRQQQITLTERGRQSLTTKFHSGDEWLATRLRDHLTPAERQILAIAAELIGKVLTSG